MQFSYIVGNFTSGYSAIKANSGGFVMLDAAVAGNATVVVQVNGGTWEIVNSAINGGAATTMLDVANAALSTTTHGVGIAWTGETTAVDFTGGDLADMLIGGNVDDVVSGGFGADTLYGSYGNDTLIGGDGNDRLKGEDGNDSLVGGDGADSMAGGNQNDTLDGGIGNDTLFGDAGDDSLMGGDGADTVNGGASNDTLLGGNDNDLLNGGAGTDSIDGGAGDDIFLDPNGDTIVTLELGDIIRLTGGAAQSLTSSHLQYNSGTKTLTVDYDKSGVFGDGTDIVVVLTNAPVAQNFQIYNNSTFAEIKLLEGPTVTDGNISIAGGSGTGGAYKIGDTVTATWNNTAGGDNNAVPISSVTVDFSAFGGGNAVAATNSSGTWTASYTITAGSIEATNRNVSVTATDNATKVTTKADTTNATVDNIAPTATFSGLGFSVDTGASNTDFVTHAAAQTITATLSGAPAGTDIVYGSLDNGASWTDITSKVTGTSLSWNGVTLAGSDTLKLKVTDAAGNDATVASQAYVLDTTAPAFQSAATSADGAKIVLTYNSALSATTAVAGDFNVLVGGVVRNITGVAVNGSTMELSLQSAVTAGQAITVSYTDPTGGDDANAVQDAAGNDAATLASTAATNNVPAPAPMPDPTPDPTPTPPAIVDNDNVPTTVENQVPGLPGANGTLAGDGNGDGIVDGSQSNVTSTTFLRTGHVSTDHNAPAAFVTLVADSKDGLIDNSDASSALLINIQQRDIPANLPPGVAMPLGMISFTAGVGTNGSGVGIVETFSLFVDKDLAVNGYWKQNKEGTWVNLASDLHGGKLVEVGNKLRLDFSIRDGGEFDADGIVNGFITDPGAAAFIHSSLLGHAPQIPHDGFWF